METSDLTADASLAGPVNLEPSSFASPFAPAADGLYDERPSLTGNSPNWNDTQKSEPVKSIVPSHKSKVRHLSQHNRSSTGTSTHSRS